MVKKVLVIVAIIIAIFGILVFTGPIAENKRSEEYKAMFAEYEIIYVNGADYKVDDIVSLQYHSSSGDAEDSITFVLKDGTVVNFDIHNYALKNKQ